MVAVSRLIVSGLLCCLSVTVCLAGCTARSSDQLATAGDHTMAVYDRSNEDIGMQVLVEAVLTSVGECIGVDGSGVLILAIFPRDAALNESGTITLSDGTSLRLGEAVRLGGGFVPFQDLNEQTRASIPEVCQTEEVLIVN
jgi:hypothetical protein